MHAFERWASFGVSGVVRWDQSIKIKKLFNFLGRFFGHSFNRECFFGDFFTGDLFSKGLIFRRTFFQRLFFRVPFTTQYYTVLTRFVLLCVLKICVALLYLLVGLHSGTIVSSCFCGNSILSCLFISVTRVTQLASYSSRFKDLCRELFGCFIFSWFHSAIVSAV